MDAKSVHLNCLKVQFGPATKMPSDKEIFAFFRKRNWAPDTLNAMFRAPREHCVYVKFRSEESMKAALLECPATAVFQYENGESVEVTFATARGDYKYVRIFGLPIEIENKELVSVLSKFGKVHSFTRERYGPDTGYPIFNGVRGIQMELSKEIPAQLYVQHFQVRVAYDGMTNRCFVCKAPDHVKADCPKRSSVSDRLQEGSTQSTYADALNGTPQPAVVPGPVNTPSPKPLEGGNPANSDCLEVPVVLTDIFNEIAFGSNLDEYPVISDKEEEEEEYTNDAEWRSTKKRNRAKKNKKQASGSDSSEPGQIKVPRGTSVTKAQAEYMKRLRSQKKE